MTLPCDNVELFVDGELPDEQAEAFRQHLPDCVQCQQAMDRLMQLDFLGSLHVQSTAAREKPAALRPTFLARWRVPVMVASAALAAALVVMVVRRPGKPSLQSDVWLAQRPQRLLEARVSYPDADLYRPPAARMMGGSEAAEELSYKDLATLQDSDPHGMVAAFLVRDNKGMAKQALQALEKLSHSPDLDSDRAVALLLEGKREEALLVLDAVLAEHPRHPQALWNRALVLRELGLTLQASQVFSEVAALKEPGRSDEAAKKAKALQDAVSARREQWLAVDKAGKALLDAPPGDLPQGFTELPSARRHFYEAVRVAPSRERVLLLQPMAQKLDERADGHVLEDYVRKVADADFSRRAPLAERYRKLLQSPTPEEQQQFLAALAGSKEEDILLGALTALGNADPKVYEEKAAASSDPWFQVLALQRRAEVAATAGDWQRFQKVVDDASQLCKGRGIEYRCIRLETELASRYSSHDELDRARMHAETGWKKALEVGEWQLESNLLWSLGEIARISDDSSLARAYLGEYAAREKDNPDAARRAHEALAVMAMQDLRVEEARREIDATLATGRPLGLPGVFALADISRLKSAPGDEENLGKAVKTVPLSQKGLGGKLITDHVLGRFFIERDAEKGRALLWRVIEQAEAPEFKESAEAQRARAYSFTSLLLEAGRRKDFQEAIKLLERERGQPLPGKCLLVATVDSERTLIIARGTDGALVGHYDDTRRQPLAKERLDGLVPEALVAPLRQCEQVEVLARAPLREQPGLLPPRLAWSYLTRTSAERRAPPTGPSVHLAVFDVDVPAAEFDLKPLNAWTPSFGPGEQTVKLSGTEATPSRVLGAMKGATEIDLVTHGILDGRSDSSFLLLAHGQEGAKLDVTQVRSASLQGAPFVVLAACKAAHPTYSVDDPLSLPAAFITAGARGVLAATVEIPDLEAQDFFNAVRERMRSGAAPALALRDERMRWLGEGRGTTWVENVLLFE
jgi:cellulose synthase operon protein C